MNTNIIALYALFVLVSICLAYVAVVFNTKLERLKESYGRALEDAEYYSGLLSDIEKTRRSLLVCNTVPKNGEDPCKGCMLDGGQDDIVDCVPMLGRRAADLLDRCGKEIDACRTRLN